MFVALLMALEHNLRQKFDRDTEKRLWDDLFIVKQFQRVGNGKLVDWSFPLELYFLLKTLLGNPTSIS